MIQINVAACLFIHREEIGDCEKCRILLVSSTLLSDETPYIHVVQ